MPMYAVLGECMIDEIGRTFCFVVLAGGGQMRLKAKDEFSSVLTLDKATEVDA